MQRVLLVDTLGSLFYHFHSKDKHLVANFIANLQRIVSKYKVNKVYMLKEGGSKYRASLLPTYKSARKERRAKYTEQEKAEYERFLKQVTEACNLLGHIGVYSLQYTGAEADDLAGYLCSVLPPTHYQIMLLSEDTDWNLLLERENTVQGSYKAMVKNIDVLTKDYWMSAKQFQQLNGWSVRQAYEAKMLCGDTADSIPGVEGLGKTGAENIMKHYGSLEALFRNKGNIEVPRITAKAKAGLLDVEQVIDRNHALMNLRWTVQEWENILGLTPDTLEEMFSAVQEPSFSAFTEKCFENGWLAFTDDDWLDVWKGVYPQR